MVIIWVFVVLILTSSYTASLTSMLTVQQLQPAVTDIAELLQNGDRIGYQDGSFVFGLLTHQLGFDKNRLINYSTVEEYANALSPGAPANQRVAAIIDEIPYLNLFLSKYRANYMMAGSTVYKTDGFGFVSSSFLISCTAYMLTKHISYSSVRNIKARLIKYYLMAHTRHS